MLLTQHFAQKVNKIKDSVKATFEILYYEYGISCQLLCIVSQQQTEDCLLPPSFCRTTFFVVIMRASPKTNVCPFLHQLSVLFVMPFCRGESQLQEKRSYNNHCLPLISPSSELQSRGMHACTLGLIHVNYLYTSSFFQQLSCVCVVVLFSPFLPFLSGV